MGFFGKYISPGGAQALLHYQYRGSDDSLWYKYVGSAFINFIVEYIPNYIAPNAITLAGLAVNVLASLFQAYYSPLLNTPTPRWVSIFTGLALFTYQTFDAIDGKQARRTGSASPLGLLFDHGCDAINTTVIALSLATTLLLGPTWWTLVMWTSMSATFFATTWEEYYTGELHLPILNGPNEGLVITCLLHIFTGLFQDPDDPFWLWYGPMGYTFGQWIAIGLVVCSVVTMLGNAINVVNAVTTNAKEEDHDPRSLSGVVGRNTHLVAITRAVPAFALLAASTAWIVYSPTDVIGRHPRLVLWTLGLLISKLLTGLMLAHLCNEEYHPFSRTLASLLTLSVHGLISYWLRARVNPFDQKHAEQYEDMLFYEFFLLSLVSWCHMVIGTTREVADILGVFVFSITTRRKPKKIR